MSPTHSLLRKVSARSRKGFCFLLPLLLLLVATTRPAEAARDAERIAQLHEQIQTLDTMQTALKDKDEVQRLKEKSGRLREELQILEERQGLESRQRELHDTLVSSPIDALREQLRSVEVGAEDGEAHLKEIMASRRKVADERDDLQAALTAKQGAADAAAKQDLEERLFTKNEELRMLALQREAAEALLDVAHEADRLREEVKQAETSTRPTLKMLYDTHGVLGEESKVVARLEALIANAAQGAKNCQSTLELSQLKLTKFDEELALLEKQTGFFRTDPRVEKLLVSQRIQKKSVADRVPFYRAQVEAAKKTEAALQTRLNLVKLEAAMLQDRYLSLRRAYVNRLSWPLLSVAAIGIVYLLFNYVLLGLVYKKESLLLARRLALYASFLAGTLAVSAFLFDDLSMVAATLGVVSAGLVISLQDVCTSVFGWFVIMLGGKFSVGDRLEIEGTRGDVIDIQLLRTTLIEVNAWLENDQPTGRVIVVPNNFIFKAKVCNYNHEHPFIWGKIDVTVTFTTPVAEAMDLFHHVLAEETADEFVKAQAGAEVFRKRYGVDDAVYQPRIMTHIADSGVVLSLFFVSHYRHQSSIRNRINRRLIVELEKNPRVQLAFNTVQVLHSNPVAGAPAAVMGGTTAAESTAPFAVKGMNFPSRPPIFPGR